MKILNKKFSYICFGMLLSSGHVFAADDLNADAPEAKLKGSYARSMSRSCIVNTDGGIFTINNQLYVVGGGSNGFPQARWSAISGNITFNGDGTGTMQSLIGRMRMNSHQVQDPDGNIVRSSKIGSQPLDRREATCTFDYDVFPDNSFTMDNFSCDSKSIPVGRTGADSVTTGIVLQGQMANGGQTLILVDNDTNKETTEILDEYGTPTGTKYERVCSRSGTAVRVNK